MQLSPSDQYLSGHYNNSLPDMSAWSGSITGLVDLGGGAAKVVIGVGIALTIGPEVAAVATLAEGMILATEALTAVGLIAGGTVVGTIGVGEIVTNQEVISRETKATINVLANPEYTKALAELVIAGVPFEKAVSLLEGIETVESVGNVLGKSSDLELAKSIETLIEQQLDRSLQLGGGNNACRADDQKDLLDTPSLEPGGDGTASGDSQSGGGPSLMSDPGVLP